MSSLKGVSPSANQTGALHSNLSLTVSPRLLTEITKGDILTVLVIKTLGDNRALISLKGAEIEADTSIPLTRGETMRVRVESHGPTLILQPVPDRTGDSLNSLLALIRKFPPEQFDRGSGLIRLITQSLSPPDTGLTADHYILDESSFAAGGETGAKKLESVIRDSGLFLENRLRSGKQDGLATDLKAVLLDLLEKIEQGEAAKKLAPESGAKPETAGITRTIAQIESNQSINIIAHDRGGEHLFQVPYLVQGKVKTFKMYVKGFNRKKGKQKNSGFSVALILDLENTDRIRVDLKLEKQNLSIAIHVKDERIKGVFNRSLETLKEKLVSYGYVTAVDCLVADKGFIDKEIITNDIVSAEHRLLDVKV